MMRRAVITMAGAIALSLGSSLTAHASGFFGVLTEQADAVLITANAASLEIGETAQANASGGNGVGSYTFASATTAQCTINGAGLITAVAAGNCAVTATRLGSGLFLDRTSASLTLVITAPAPEDSGTNAALNAAAGAAYSVEFNLSSGLSSEFSWSGAERVLVIVQSPAGSRESEFQAASDGKGIAFVDGLIPGYINKVTVKDIAGKWTQVKEIAVPPLKITGISATSATAATNFTYTLKWRPQSHLEFYKITITGPDDQPLTYYSKTPDWTLARNSAGRFRFEIVAQGEGDALSEPVRFVATVTNPVNISAKLPTNPTSDRLTIASSNQLKSIANRLTAQTEVTVTVYYDPKVKGAKKLAQTRVARAAATIKVTKPTLVVKTEVRKQISAQSLRQISLKTKAPARKLTLTNA